jgi:hypothetical protein
VFAYTATRWSYGVIQFAAGFRPRFIDVRISTNAHLRIKKKREKTRIQRIFVQVTLEKDLLSNVLRAEEKKRIHVSEIFLTSSWPTIKIDS